MKTKTGQVERSHPRAGVALRDAAHRLTRIQQRRAAAKVIGRQEALDAIEDEIAEMAETLLALRDGGIESMVCKALYLKETLGGQPDDLAGALALSLCDDILATCHTPAKRSKHHN